MSQTNQTIKVRLNGKEQEIQEGMSVSDLLLKWKIRPELVTVELNEDILQKLDYDGTKIKSGDNVDASSTHCRRASRRSNKSRRGCTRAWPIPRSTATRLRPRT